MSSVSAPSEELDAPVAPPPQTRSCLRCQEEFMSEWAGEGGTIISHSSAGF